jgi:hypothetical protein
VSARGLCFGLNADHYSQAVAEPDDVAFAESDLFYARSIHERAVGTAQVAHDEQRPATGDLGMLPRHPWIFEAACAVGASADHYAFGVEAQR